MNRITPQQVVDAYGTTGLKPIKGSFFYRADDGTRCGCALTSLVLSRHPMFDATTAISRKAQDEFGMNADYFLGFIAGWDDGGPTPAYQGDYVAGFADGDAAALACKEAGIEPLHLDQLPA